jgi:hypothetical protein
MAEFVRVAEFEADDAAVDALVKEIEADAGPPEGVPATAITILRSIDSNKLRIATFFGSEDDLRKGSETLDAMNPPEDLNIRRVAVEKFQVALTRKAP